MTEFVHTEMEGAPFHYTDCGLDNVWLYGGVRYHDTAYGPATSIHNIDELHDAIGMSIVRSDGMSGAEFRFLRVELDLSQRALASLLGTMEQNIHRWETGKTELPGPAIMALKGYYLESLDPKSRMKEMMDELSNLDATLLTIEKKTFSSANDTWTLDPVA